MFSVTTLLSQHPDGNVPLTPDKTIDYTHDFFARPSFLSVSGQLNVETHCCALSDVYTFGPTFRAENSNTSRHLAEFWMIEPEIAFATLEDDMDLAEDYLKYCVQYALDHCTEDLAFFNKNVEKGLIERLRATIASPFVRLSYTDAVALLAEPEHAKKAKFTVQPVWGTDLGSEHERYLTEVVYKKPVVLFDYPKECKSFYMRLNDDGKTVAAADVLVPHVGELIGGSAREERLDVLETRLKEAGANPDDYKWYLDLRKYGSVPHAGFGLGFERLIRFVTGIENIRDVIPFPRWPGNAAHVILPKEMQRQLPDRLLTETEWRQLGVQQSRGWVHYAIHKQTDFFLGRFFLTLSVLFDGNECRPEPHILLFRRPLGTDPTTGRVDMEMQKQAKEKYAQEFS
ncbi:hypothetical protein PsorP6_013266 [Peronosclerospora sorghi]|uniref:Uncharacterized protein n=1 Tax=Peronosclerospora sorghi TaxID=230839 RepID=A0ACC0WET5_9STRA|nr:hypothetical protein PsorP6_013266 [Peronosclerospora sorghi]